MQVHFWRLSVSAVGMQRLIGNVGNGSWLCENHSSGGWAARFIHPEIR